MAVAAFDALRSPLNEGAARLGIPLTDMQATRLLDYLGLIAQWNQVYNLTAVREPQAMLAQHLLDSLSVLPPLARRLPGPGRLLDVGSGAGLPGVVIAICRPDLAVTCVDTVGKKASFIRQVAAQLGLPSLEARHARVEQLAEAGAFHVVTSRAFASLDDFTRLTRPLLATGAWWMAMKGKRPDDELAAVAQRVVDMEVEPLQVPGLDADRCLVWMRPAA